MDEDQVLKQFEGTDESGENPDDSLKGTTKKDNPVIDVPVDTSVYPDS